MLEQRDTIRQHFDHERFKLGEVQDARTVDLDEAAMPQELAPAGIYRVRVSDPHLEMIPSEMLDSVRQHEQLVDRFARLRRFRGKWSRMVGTAYTDQDGELIEEKSEWGDPVSHENFFTDLDSQGLQAWLRLIPSASALAYLSDPLTLESVKDKKGREQACMDDMARLWLTACTDAIGIRSRGVVMADLVKGYIAGDHSPDQLKWMSVACGTALPAMKAANNAGVEPSLMLVDIDPNAMRATAGLADEIDFHGELSQHRINIFSDQEMANLRESLGSNGERPRIIDLMGIFEYTGENLGVDPAQFLRSNYDMLHRGGRLIFGQMRSDRPVPDFTMGVVGWPFVEMRSPRQVMQLICDAGIDSKTVNIYMPEDGVYMVVSIDKPETPESFIVAA